MQTLFRPVTCQPWVLLVITLFGIALGVHYHRVSVYSVQAQQKADTEALLRLISLQEQALKGKGDQVRLLQTQQPFASNSAQKKTLPEPPAPQLSRNAPPSAPLSTSASSSDPVCRPGTQRCGDSPFDMRDGSDEYKAKLRQFVELHNKMIDPTSTVDRRQFVVYEATNDGLGNKLLPMISAFGLALLLDRGFLVDWEAKWERNPGSIDELFVAPNGINEWHYHIIKERFPSLASRSTEINMRSADGNTEKRNLLCDNQLDTLRQYDVIVIPGDQYFLPLLAENDHHKQQFLKWFRRDNMFGPLARFVLNPRPDVRETVAKFKAEHFGDYNIGLQIRRKERLGMRDDEIAVFWQCSKQLASFYTPKGGKTRYFIATDGFDVREMARRNLGDQAVFPTHQTNRDMIDGVRWALIEIILLSECDDIITTPSSTFGYSGHALSSKVPHRVFFDKTCRRVNGAEPHAHYWKPLFREADRWRLCKREEDAISMFQTEECCPRW